MWRLRDGNIHEDWGSAPIRKRYEGGADEVLPSEYEPIRSECGSCEASQADAGKGQFRRFERERRASRFILA
jgi:hypothetical protein